MKTIFDAVNELMGDLKNLGNCGNPCNRISLFRFIGEAGILSTATSKYELVRNDRCEYICGIPEFNALVSDLENWQPTPSVGPLADLTYAEYKDSFERGRESFKKRQITYEPIISAEGPTNSSVTVEPESKPEMETFKGMQYEVGKWYEFSNDGDNWEASKLDAIEGSNFAFLTSLGWMQLCREATLSLGTITPAPVDLVDGAAYEFMCFDKKYYGEYRKYLHRFYCGDYYYTTDDCTNITRLVPEVKS
jgi:hypothetical protein